MDSILSSLPKNTSGQVNKELNLQFFAAGTSNSTLNDGLGSLDWTNSDSHGRLAIEHIQKHAKPDYQRKMHGVFRRDPKTVIEEAWTNRVNARVVSDGMGGTVYNIPYYNVGYQTGYDNFGQQLNYVTIIVKTGTSIVWSAFPSFGDHRMKTSY